MAFKQEEKKKMSKGMITAIVIVVLLMCGAGAWSVWQNKQAQEQQAQQEQEQTQEEMQQTEDVSDMTTAQNESKIQETDESKEFWTLICSSKWNDTSTGAVLEFNQEKSYYKEELAKNNNKHVQTFVICKFKKTSNNVANGQTEDAYSATCMSGDNKVFDLSLVVSKTRSGENEKVSNMVITSDGFTLGSYYTRIVNSENFQVSGLNAEKLKAFGVNTDTLTQKVKEYCSANMPSVTKLDFTNAKVTGFMNQNYVIFSVVPSGTGKSSSKTIYIMYFTDTGEVQVSETNAISSY